jgi:hypothetical protein
VTDVKRQNPLPLRDEERPFKEAMSRLSADADGNEIYIGLTREETEWLLNYRSRWGSVSNEERKRAISLQDRHKVARLQVLSALREMRDTNPTKN